MSTGSTHSPGLYVAVDVHYLRSGAARAAAVVAADAAFTQVLGEYTELVSEVAAYRPGEFYRRELPPLSAVLQHIGGLGCWWSTATPISTHTAAPAWERMRTRRLPSQ